MAGEMDSTNPAPREGVLKGTLEKWRALLLRTNYICAIVVLFTEIGMFFVFRAEGLFLQSIPVYLFRFLVLPTIVDALILGVGHWLARRYRERERVLNYIPIVQMTLICFMVSTVHHVFAVTFCTFCFPIFLTVLFDDRKMTAWITGLSVVCLSLAQIWGPDLNDVISSYLFPQYLVALAALLASNVVCSVLARFQQERNQLVEHYYRAQMRMVEQLNLDQKTGLFGSTAFQNRLRQAVDGATGSGVPGLAVFDIDNFKQVNDTYGHAKGDEVLLALAELMKRVCGDRYMPVRFGGEEFAVIFTGGGEKDYFEVADRIRNDFSALRYDFTKSPITLSAGLAMWRAGWDDDALFEKADKAMYQSKQQGKNRTTVYDAEEA